ncbi:MAG: aminoacyl-tRNA hydrolase [Pseudomonadota bacterium]
MLLFVGLGNPGRGYARHRHNIGYMAVDRIAEDHGFGAWKGKFQGMVADGRLGGEKVLLLKPETWMNLSGQSVAAAMRFHKIPVEDVVVFHDELDLAPGKCRVKRGGGHAGHNGLRSIHQHCGSDYARVRLGIGHPGRKEAVSAYVLHDFAKADEARLDDLLRGVSDGAPKLAAGDDAGFMNAVALRMQPAAPKKPTPKAEAKPSPAPEPEAEKEARLSPFERLKRHFSS